jgi:16S rRNA (uracil1498-N3)-methyltransferase
VTAPHFFVEHLAGVEPGHVAELSPADSRHALRALRLRPGEDVTLADGAGWFARGRMVPAPGRGGDRRSVASVEVLEVEARAQPSPAVTVVMAPPKGDRLAWAVQKLAEVGSDRLVLVTDAERAVREVGGERGRALLERLRAIAREAAMQSRRPFVMEIAESGLDAVLEGVSARGPVLMLWEGATEPLGEALPSLRAAAPDAILLLVGPEGSFAQSEIDRAQVAGAHLVSLGPSILRTETAALAAAAIVLSAFGRLG